MGYFSSLGNHISKTTPVSLEAFRGRQAGRLRDQTSNLCGIIKRIGYVNLGKTDEVKAYLEV